MTYESDSESAEYIHEEEWWEHERRRPIAGWSSSHLLPGSDPHHFVCCNTGRSADQLPPAPAQADRIWKDGSSWRVDLSISPFCDESGWVYGPHFGVLGAGPGGKRDCVRRRRQIRSTELRRRTSTRDVRERVTDQALSGLSIASPSLAAAAAISDSPGAPGLAASKNAKKSSKALLVQLGGGEGPFPSLEAPNSFPVQQGEFAIDVIIHSVPFRVRGKRDVALGWVANQAAAFFSRVNSRYRPAFQAQVTALYPNRIDAQMLDEATTVSRVLSLGLTPWGARNVPALLGQLQVQVNLPPGPIGIDLDGTVKDRPVVEAPHVSSPEHNVKNIPPPSLAADVLRGMILTGVAVKARLSPDGFTALSVAEMENYDTGAMMPREAARLLKAVEPFPRILTFSDPPPVHSAEANLAHGLTTDSTGSSSPVFDLTVTVAEVRGIAAAKVGSIMGPSSVVVLLRLAGKSRMTSIKSKPSAGAAVWNETFHWKLLSLGWNLECQLWDHSNLGSEKGKLGEASVPLIDHINGREADMWLHMVGGIQLRLLVKVDTIVKLWLISCREARATELLQRAARKLTESSSPLSAAGQDIYRLRLLNIGGAPLETLHEARLLLPSFLCGGSSDGLSLAEKFLRDIANDTPSWVLVDIRHDVQDLVTCELPKQSQRHNHRAIPPIHSRHRSVRVSLLPADQRHSSCNAVRLTNDGGGAVYFHRLGPPYLSIATAAPASSFIEFFKSGESLIKVSFPDELDYWRWVTELSFCVQNVLPCIHPTKKNQSVGLDGKNDVIYSGRARVSGSVFHMELSSTGVHWKPAGASYVSSPYNFLPLSEVTQIEFGQLASTHGEKLHVLTVSVESAHIEGHKKAYSRSLGGLHTFARVVFGGTSSRTRSAVGAHPIYGANFEFTTEWPATDRENAVRIEIWARKMSRDIELGKVLLPLSSLIPDQEWSGDLDVTYRPTRLSVELLAAVNLPRADKMGTCDPYCVLYPVLLDGTIVESEKRKSSAKKQTLNPDWGGESFTFGGECATHEFACVRVDVWDSDHAKSDDFLGRVDIPLSFFTSQSSMQPIDLILQPTSACNMEKLKSYGLKFSSDGSPLLGTLKLIAREVPWQREVGQESLGVSSPPKKLNDQESVSVRLRCVLSPSNEYDFSWPCLAMELEEDQGRLREGGESGGGGGDLQLPRDDAGGKRHHFSLVVGYEGLLLATTQHEEGAGDILTSLDSSHFIMQDGEEGHLYLEVWENQRHSTLSGWGSGRLRHLTSKDPRRYSDAKGQQALGAKDIQEVPPPKGWDFLREAEWESSDWVYGPTFEGLILTSSYAGLRHQSGKVRRRRWCRRLSRRDNKNIALGHSEDGSRVPLTPPLPPQTAPKDSDFGGGKSTLCIPFSSLSRMCVVTDGVLAIESSHQNLMLVVEPCHAARLANLILDRFRTASFREKCQRFLHRKEQDFDTALLGQMDDMIASLTSAAATAASATALSDAVPRIKAYLLTLMTSQLESHAENNYPALVISAAKDWDALETYLRKELCDLRLSHRAKCAASMAVSDSVKLVCETLESLVDAVRRLTLYSPKLSEVTLKRSLEIHCTIYFVTMLNEIGQHVSQTSSCGLAPLGDDSMLALIEFLVSSDDIVRRRLYPELARMGWAIAPLPRFSSHLPLRDILRAYASSAELKLTALIHSTFSTNVTPIEPRGAPFLTLRAAVSHPQPKSWVPVTSMRILETYMQVVEKRLSGRVLVMRIVLQAGVRSFGTLCHQLEAVASQVANCCGRSSIENDHLDVALTQYTMIANDAWDIISVHLLTMEDRLKPGDNGDDGSESPLATDSLDTLRRSFTSLGIICARHIARMILNDLEREGLLAGSTRSGSATKWKSVRLTLRDYFDGSAGIRTTLNSFFFGKLLGFCADHICARILGDLISRAAEGERLNQSHLLWLKEVESIVGEAFMESAGGLEGPYTSRLDPLRNFIALLTLSWDQLKKELIKLLTESYPSCQLSLQRLLSWILELRADGNLAPLDLQERADPENFLGSDSVSTSTEEQLLDSPLFHRLFTHLPSVSYFRDELSSTEERRAVLQQCRPLTVLQKPEDDGGLLLLCQQKEKAGGNEIRTTRLSLKIAIGAVEGLPRSSKWKLSGKFFVKVELGDQSVRTESIKCRGQMGGSCMWNETLEVVTDEVSSLPLLVGIYQKGGPLSDTKCVGSVTLPLTALELVDDQDAEGMTSESLEWQALERHKGQEAPQPEEPLRLMLQVKRRALAADLRV